MKQRNCTAGIFIADDKIIYGILPRGERRLHKPVSSMTIGDFPCSDNVKQDIHEAINRINDFAIHGKANALPYKIYGIAIGAPGPIPVSGRSPQDNPHYGMTNGFNRRKTLRNLNLKQLVAQVLDEEKYTSFYKHLNIFIYHDAAAYAFGEYTFRKLKYVESLGPTTDAGHYERAMEEYHDNTLHVQILADEGIGGSIVAYNEVAQHNMHSEFGHILVPKHPDEKPTFKPKCEMHYLDRCLESYVSLPALRARYKDDNFLLSYPDLDYYDPKLDLIGYYLAQLIVQLVLTIAPTRVVLCGRIVTENQHILEIIQDWVKNILGPNDIGSGMFPGYESQRDLRQYISVREQENSGVYGCALLAARSTKGMQTIDNVYHLQTTRNGYANRS